MSSFFTKKSSNQRELYETGLILEGVIYPPEGDLEEDHKTLDFLVDTGASISGLSNEIIQELGLPLISYQDIGSADGSNRHSCHMANIIVEPMPMIDEVSKTKRFIEVDLSGQSDYQGLLGRDLLVDKFFNYEGFTGNCLVSV